MHKPKSAQENYTHDIRWDVVLYTDQLIPARSNVD